MLLQKDSEGEPTYAQADLAYLRPIPNMVIGAPMTKEDLQQMMRLAKDYDGPIAIRYPRGRTNEGDEAMRRLGDEAKVTIGKGVCLRESEEAKVAVLSLGAIGHTVIDAIRRLGDKAKVAHYDMRWLKRMDEQLLHEIGKRFTTIITVEDGVISGGLGSAVLEFMILILQSWKPFSDPED